MTGRDPSTIFRALRKGRLSYSKDPAGNRRIDVAELERVFPIESGNPRDGRSDDTCNAQRLRICRRPPGFRPVRPMRQRFGYLRGGFK